jgi:copper chaperone CopZ
MKSITIEIPSLYGDHHVIEIRHLLLNIQGVTDVYASSAFRVVEVSYDPLKTNDLQIQLVLDEAGYLGEWSIPGELGEVIEERNEKLQFSRHTEVFETTKQIVGFSQKVETSQRPLWNCPGIGVMTTQEIIKKMEE